MQHLSHNVNLNSHRVQLIATAVAASATTAALFTAYTTYTRRSRRRELNADILRSISASASSSKGRKLPTPDDSNYGDGSHDDKYAYTEGLMQEQLARNYAFFGEEGMAAIRGKTVVVVGCGGVGSWAAVMLVRSGVSKIRLVDFDQVTLSSLNRHATAVLADVGTPKVKCIARTLRQIARWADIDCRVELWKKGEDGDKLLEGADWVIDAIDNITTKVDLLKHCHDNGIKIFSSMGAGAKCDPTRVHISDISFTVYDPLARAVRQRLRRLGVSSGIPVVYSSEVPGDVKLLPLPDDEFQKGSVKELGVLDDFRVRILPVIGPLPSLFGLHIASYVLCEMAGKPILNPLPIRNRRKIYERLLKDLQTREAEKAGANNGNAPRLPLDEDDVALLFEDIHRGRSVVPPHLVPTKPMLVRWDPSRPISLENIVVMDAPEAKRHEGENSWGVDVHDVVAKRVREIEAWRNWVM
ncbi:unnamed protein product [Mycena citricolor]|uniref:THIF-type NAD/FAD binding fold domain-containing protein n=1 Tax=Mycena citricolor TaxID=2018698 RepID=A0AAD2H5B2_9AGAR|nr:unnamed protein product [Mycena citricolor]